jgi:hypothetical protein
MMRMMQPTNALRRHVRLLVLALVFALLFAPGGSGAIAEESAASP